MWRFILILVPFQVHADSLVASKMIKAHTVLHFEDLEMVKKDFPEGISDFAEIIGMETLITLYPGKPILASNLAPKALIERNQIVVISYALSGLEIRTEGRALMRGANGDFIEVMNQSSRSKVYGKIMADGVVHVASTP